MDLFACEILLVDDNRELQEMLGEMLAREGYRKLLQAYSCREAREMFAQRRPELVILDVMLPDGDGFSLFREFREDSNVPILFLSARDEDNNRLLGLGMGADDYITKPFLPQELLLRIQAVLKRVYIYPALQMQQSQVAQVGRYQVDLRNASVDRDGREVTLTAKELLLFKKLWENRGNIVTFDALCQAVWNDDYYGYENTLMVHIRRLREKIEEDPSHPRWILTIRGLGYRLAAEKKDGL
ncbi:MAG: response regulator transcription factor [Lachnospiraceae bacterium]|nr:response regulator transcription factor [Lachnospiraceae bacterium]MCI9545886.1 response regulator transcription factor [Lachnospiraceae bacterium]